jgi:hypothetical protein
MSGASIINEAIKRAAVEFALTIPANSSREEVEELAESFFAGIISFSVPTKKAKKCCDVDQGPLDPAKLTNKCAATTAKGSRCTKTCKEGEELCTIHLKQRDKPKAEPKTPIKKARGKAQSLKAPGAPKKIAKTPVMSEEKEKEKTIGMRLRSMGEEGESEVELETVIEEELEEGEGSGLTLEEEDFDE